jgi:hypothetical protein
MILHELITKMPWRFQTFRRAILATSLLMGLVATGSGATDFKRDIEPLLERYCFDCHTDEDAKGGVDFDTFDPKQDYAASRGLWWRVLKNVRANLMPPPEKSQPSAAERTLLERWIKTEVFASNPAQPDPGRVTLRRLNRVEYRNTIRDLVGIDFDTSGEFPPDDTGHGFDNIGDVLTLSPLLLEKYLEAARTIVAQLVPETEDAGARPRARRNAPRFFTKPIPTEVTAQREYAGELLRDFATRAFRRPVDDGTLRRLVDLAEQNSRGPGQNFQSGIAQALVAVLASPRFLFREEAAIPSGQGGETGVGYPLVDEYSLASRLSYFLWASMPDAELFQLAGAGKLREQLPQQLQRMWADSKSSAFIRNFVGQWLHARDIESVQVDARAVIAREDGRPAGRRRGDPVRGELTGALRTAMRQETERVFEYVLREDRNLTELLDSDYTFLNEALANHYGITNVTGRDMQYVKLPEGSPRGGLLTQGTMLIVTSNPTRTSPVKRGVFILENILGTPPPPPPPDIPPLDAVGGQGGEGPKTLRDMLAKHREEPACRSCHNRMDPLGLAFENFNALGLWREQELNAPVDAAGQLITGEKFSGVAELKKILAQKYATTFYRTLTEKMLTFALGRGLEYWDEVTVDAIVFQLEQAQGRPSALLRGVVESAPFQRTRGGEKRTAAHALPPAAALAFDSNQTP